MILIAQAGIILPLPNTVLYLGHYNKERGYHSCPELKEARINRKSPTIMYLRLQRSRNLSLPSIQKAIEENKTALKDKRAALKKTEKELSKLEAKKAVADQKAAEEAKKAEAESVVKKLLASGMSADEILEKLK